jgi:hypothetical protein
LDFNLKLVQVRRLLLSEIVPLDQLGLGKEQQLSRVVDVEEKDWTCSLNVEWLVALKDPSVFLVSVVHQDIGHHFDFSGFNITH